MKHASKLLLTHLSVFAALSSFAQPVSRQTDATYEYKGEVGFFQKANRDLSDPVFMFHDKDNKLDFGIGGTVKVNAFYDFAYIGTENFIAAAIAVPSDPSKTFNLTAKSCELHAKARYYLGDHKVTSFLKLGGTSSKAIEIKEAYISFDGFSIGLIPTFFSDLQVGLLTAGCNVTSPVNNTHPLIGYKRQFGKKWEAGISLEKPELKIPSWLNTMGGDTYGVMDDAQPVPDVTLHVKYKWNTGHVQLGLLGRSLRYWTYNNPQATVEGESYGVFGYGISLTGSQKVNSMLKLSAELVGGNGINAYMDGIKDRVGDLGVWTNWKDAAGLYMMGAVPVFNGLVGAELKWSPLFTSSVSVSMLRVFNRDEFRYPTILGKEYVSCPETLVYGQANFFWHITKLAYAGVEWLGGWSKHRDWPLPDQPDNAFASRLMAVFAFMF